MLANMGKVPSSVKNEIPKTSKKAKLQKAKPEEVVQLPINNPVGETVREDLPTEIHTTFEAPPFEVKTEEDSDFMKNLNALKQIEE